MNEYESPNASLSLLVSTVSTGRRGNHTHTALVEGQLKEDRVPGKAIALPSPARRRAVERAISMQLLLKGLAMEGD